MSTEFDPFAVYRDFNATRELQVFFDAVNGFVAAVDWSERWLQALLGAHVALFVLLLATRRNMNVQIAAFFSLCKAQRERPGGACVQRSLM